MARIITTNSVVIVPGSGTCTATHGEVLKLQLDETAADAVSVRIYSSDWRELARIEDQASPFEFDLSSLSPGKYNIEFRPTKDNKYYAQDRRVCTIIIEAANPTTAPAPAPVPAPVPAWQPLAGQRGVRGRLTDMELNGKAISGPCLIENRRIVGAKGQTRLIDPAPGVTQRFRNCEFVGGDAASAAEETTIFPPGSQPYYAIFENCTFDARSRYALFFQCRTPEGKPIRDPAVMFAILHRCVLKSSDYETPVRFMEGVDVDIDDSSLEDVVDIGGKKANAVARFHCPRVRVRNSTLKGMTKFGFELGTFPTDIECVDVAFLGIVQFEGPIGKKSFKGCTLNGKPFSP